MQVDDVGTAAVPIVVADPPTPSTAAALSTALNKVTTFLNRRRRASFSVVVRFAYKFLLLAYANRIRFVHASPGSGGY